MPEKSLPHHARGVTRPMAEQNIRKQSQQEDGKSKGGDEMSHDDRRQMLDMHHKQTLWVYWTLILLGVWVMLAPFTFGYGTATAVPSGGRSVWLSMDARVAAMTWSDLIAGAMLVVFGWRSLTPNRPKSLWTCAVVGVWLSIAPLVFWSPSAAGYASDTIVGMAVIALAILIPGMPNMVMYMEMGPPTPPGWSYNPSSWPQRWIMIVLAFAGWMVSRYLAAFQLGYIETVWDPFFGDASRQVLNSNMSHSLPISDAGLGALAYTFEFLMGWMGGPARWRTMPWMVTFFGILVIPLGLVHILLVISQPVVVGAWCTLCLAAAAIMLPMLPLEGDEVIAMGQHLRAAKRRGQSLWRTFWKGGSAEGSTPDERSPALMELPQRPGAVVQASLWGMSWPWTLLAAAALGVIIMGLPGLFGTQGIPADIYHLGGALIVTFAVIALGEPFRLVRYVAVLLGLVVAAGPWIASGASPTTSLIGSMLGLAAAALCIPRGPKSETYGDWDKLVR